MVSIALDDRELTPFYPAMHDLILTDELRILDSTISTTSTTNNYRIRLTGSFISFSNFSFCNSVALRGTVGFSDGFFSVCSILLSSAILVI